MNKRSPRGSETMDVTKEIDLLKRYFKNKASEGVVTLNGEDVLAAFAKLSASLETLCIGTADRMTHNIDAYRDRYQWVRKQYIAARQEFDRKPGEKSYFTFLRWQETFNRAKESLDNAYDLGQGQPWKLT